MIAIGEYTISTIFDGDSYVIQPSVSSVVIEDSGTYNPSEITFNNKHKQGTGELENYSGRLKIETTSDNTNWTTQYTSSSNETSKVYSLPSATVDKEPYNFRKSPVASGSKSGTIIGGSLVWNQLIDNADFKTNTTVTKNGITIEYSPTAHTFTVKAGGTATAAISFFLTNPMNDIPAGHKVLVTGLPREFNSGTELFINVYNKSGSNQFYRNMISPVIIGTGNQNFISIFIRSGFSVASDIVLKPQCIDLTTMFGSTIADYIYTLEQATAGAGVAWVKRYIDLDTYHEYDAGSIQSVEGLERHDVVGKNLLPKLSPRSSTIRGVNFSVQSDGTIIANGKATSDSQYYFPIIGGANIPVGEYYFSGCSNGSHASFNSYVWDTTNNRRAKKWDGTSSVDSDIGQSTQNQLLIQQGIEYRFVCRVTNGYSADNVVYKPMIFFPDQDSSYEPYEKHSYPLDSSVTLRGVPKLVTDHIEFDGDRYRADGTVERRYGVVDLGTLMWNKANTPNNHWRFGATLSTVAKASSSSDVFNGICTKYNSTSPSKTYDGETGISNNNATNTIFICDESFSDATTLKTAMSGVYLVYQLATPTTETAQPYQSPMLVGQTEEYVSNSIVPVGHETKYTSDIKNIRASLYKAGGITVLLNQITIPVLSQEDFKPKLVNTIRQYTKSTSSTSLPSNPTWVDDEEPTIGDNEYMWARLKHVYSDGTFVYSNAVCSTSISGAIHDVDKANKSITDKVWESDITTKINQYDGSTVSTIRDRVTSTEQNISGITSRVSDVESSVTDEANQRKATFGTCDTGAGTAVKAVTCENFELRAGSTISVKFTNTNTTASPTLNVNSTGAKAIKSYTGQNLTEGEYKWAAGSVYDFIYDGQYWRLSDSGSLKRITSAESSITQNAANIELKVSKDGVISSINQSPESVTINADKVNIEGAAIFSSGRLSQTNLNNAYDSKGSAAAVQTNLDNLEIGGRNLARNTGERAPDVTSQVEWVGFDIGELPITTNEVLTVSFDLKMVIGTAVTNGSPYLQVYNTNYKGKHGQWIGITNSASYPVFIPIGNYPVGTIIEKRCSCTITTPSAFVEGTMEHDWIEFYSNYSTENAITITNIKVEKGNKPTSWTPAPEDQFASTVPCYYRKTTSGAPSAPSSTIGTSNNTDNTWTYVMPLPKKNCYFFTCEEYTSVGGTKSYSTVRALDSQTYTSKWVSSSDQTYIDGGSIYTHSITTNQLATDAIKSNNYSASPNADSPYSATGSFLDLTTGNFYTPNFGIDNTDGKAYLNGEIIADSGQIGSDTTNYWEIGTKTDYNANDSAAIIGHGSSYIQSGGWMISSDRIDTRSYDNSRKYTYLNNNNTYWDFGLHVPNLSSSEIYENNFVYIRKHASTIPTLEGQWDYVFRIDKDGGIEATGLKINGTSIQDMIDAGVDGGAYLPTSGGTISGNLTVTGTITGLKTLSVNGKTYNGTSAVDVGTIGASYGGTGQTSLKASGTAIIGALDTNTTTPVDNDYIATGSSTFYRKTMSKLWDYIKGKLSADHSSLDSAYVKKSGDTMTGSLTVENGIYADSAQLGDLVVSGSGRFANGLYGNLIGNADTATMASGVADSGNGTKTTFAYSKSGLSTASWIAAWSGYELRAISPANLLTTIGAVAKSGDTMTGTLIAPEFSLSGGVNSTTAGFRLTNNGTNMDMGWTWTGAQGAGACFTSTEHPNQPGMFDFFARAKNSSNQEVTKHLIGSISGILTWDNRRVVTATNSTVVGGTSTPIYIDANGYAQACTSISATKFSSVRTISLTGDVTGSASSDGTSGWSITTTVGNDSHQHTPSTIITGDSGVSGAVDPITRAMIGSAASNKTFGLPANAITIEYSTDGGSTWIDYGATDSHKKNLFMETRTGCSTYLGKATTKQANSINNQLRITIEPTDRYVVLDGLYIWMVACGNTVTVDLERSTIGAKDTYTTVFTGQHITGWAGNNIRYFPSGSFGGGTTQTTNNYKYRLIFKQTAINADNPSGYIIDIRFLGMSVHSSSINMVNYNHLYSWDENFNATFPAGITATSFTGNASSASKLNSTRSFTIGNTVKNIDWSGAVSFSKAEISDEASSTANGWMSVADKKKLDSITVSDIGTIGANSIRGEKDIKVTISSGIATIGHENSAITAGTISGTATSTLSNGGSFKIPSITYDAYGHITGTSQTTITLPNITSVSGNAGTATKFSSNRAISLSGDTSGSATTDGSSGWSIATTTNYLTHALARPASANVVSTQHLTKIYSFLASSSMTEGKPTADGTIIHFPWDNKGWAGQLYVPNSKGLPLQFRAGDEDSGATSWEDWKTILDSSNYTDYTVKKDGTGASGTWGISISGTAAKATADSDGNTIKSTYAKLSGTTFTGAVNFANNTLNLIGDDAYLGDQNVAGCVVIKGKNGASGIQFNPYSGSTSQKISIDGSGNMTITGNIVSDATGTLGSTSKPFHQLVLGGTTNGTVDATSTNPRITFCENTGTQPVHLIYSDWDSYRSPAGLKITGDSSASSSPAWLEVEGTIYAPTFSGTATKATADASGNTITSTYAKIASPTFTGVVTSPYYISTQNMTVSAGKITELTTAPRSGLFANGVGITNPATRNDVGWIRMQGTGESDTIMEIATGDDGSEQIFVRQYNTSNAIVRELKLLDSSGNTSVPCDLKIGGHVTLSYSSTTDSLDFIFN